MITRNVEWPRCRFLLPVTCLLILGNSLRACGGFVIHGLPRPTARISLASAYFSPDDDEDASFSHDRINMYEDNKKPHRATFTMGDGRIENELAPNSWGIHHARTNLDQAFPSTLESLLDGVVMAISGTWEGRQKLDPNVVANAMMGNRLGRRPVRHSFDAGRVGVELDGVGSFFNRPQSEASALRKTSILLAIELAEKFGTSVAVYCNTIGQSLMASNDLQLFKRLHAGERDRMDILNNITVSSLSQDDNLPPSMTDQRLSNPQLSRGAVYPKRGIVLVVQPTDYNAEYRPPAPAFGSLDSLQRLATRASMGGIPMVVVSPRYLTMEAPFYGLEQSGYQQCSIYGGHEPARGPTHWLMRDFSPPIYFWNDKVLPVPSQLFRDTSGKLCRYSHLSLMQSVMLEGHGWHIFVQRKEAESERKLSYEYLASTQPSAGRPTKNVLNRIFDEFATYE